MAWAFMVCGHFRPVPIQLIFSNFSFLSGELNLQSLSRHSTVKSFTAERNSLTNTGYTWSCQ